MNTSSPTQSAKIYIFQRKPGAAAQPLEKMSLTPDPAQIPVCDADAWYHQAAVAESQQTRKS
jgi:hypothetical protein